MTVGIAWLGTRADGRKHLFFASDSRVRGEPTLDMCPKILILPRGDCAICYAGYTSTGFSLMLQINNAIEAHQPARERNLDITRLKDHLLRVFSDIAQSVQGGFDKKEVEFIFGGYSWLRKEFLLWTVQISGNRFLAREAKSFHPNLGKAAFVGDWGTRMRSKLLKALGPEERAPVKPVYLAPLRYLGELIAEATDPYDTIGGAPQLVRVSEHMTTRPLCVLWGTPPKVTLFGRPLFDYENCDHWIVEPTTGAFSRPRKFGRRHDEVGRNDDE